MNIYQKMAAITAELRTVAKNLNVETGNGKAYKAVAERDILDAVKPLEEKYGVYSYPFSRDTVESARLEQTTKYGTKTVFYTRIKTIYRFVNIDDPTDYMETSSFSVGLDSGDKGDGKAMTYGDKYALMKGYKITTGDDPDQSASIDAVYTATGNDPTPPVIMADESKKEADPQRRMELINEIYAMMNDYSQDEKRTIFSMARQNACIGPKEDGTPKTSGTMKVSELEKMKECVSDVIGRMK